MGDTYFSLQNASLCWGGRLLYVSSTIVNPSWEGNRKMNGGRGGGREGGYLEVPVDEEITLEIIVILSKRIH